MKYHCFFEQSGTFKNEFKKLGYEAYDYDILNDFEETDYCINLFDEIEKAYENKKSIFDSFTEKDFIIAFFPCVRFEDQVTINFRGENAGMMNYSEKQKIEYDIKLHKELHELYVLWSKLCIVCIDRKIPLILENPRGTMHYLNRYWCVKPKIVDTDRRKNGDYYKKPTQYWFFNCEPQKNFIFEPIDHVITSTISECKLKKGKNRTVNRSLIHPQYANRFIRQQILEEV